MRPVAIWHIRRSRKIDTNIIDSYELTCLDAEDQELYTMIILIANLKLYFDKFEGELADTVSEPTNQAYDMAKDNTELSGGTDEPAEDDALELDF